MKHAAPFFIMFWGLTLLGQFAIAELLRHCIKRNALTGRMVNSGSTGDPAQTALAITRPSLQQAYLVLFAFGSSAALWTLRASPKNILVGGAVANLLCALCLLRACLNQRNAGLLRQVELCKPANQDMRGFRQAEALGSALRFVGTANLGQGILVPVILAAALL